MTEQYAQRNINNPEGSRNAANTTTETDFTLTPSDTDKVVILDTTEAAGTATLPRAAAAGAGAEITVIASVGSANPLTLAVITGVPGEDDDVLVTPAGAPANPAVTDNASFIVRSDGNLSWYIVGGLA